MALAIDASTPVYKSSVPSVAAQTTASFTPPLNSLLVVLYACASTGVAMAKPTNTGGAVTWDAAIKASELANLASAAVWCGLVTTSASMTVTETLGGAQTDWGIGVAVVTGQAATQNGATQIATSASGAPSATIASTVGANSLILGTVGNFSNGTLPTVPGGQSTTFNGNAFSFQDGTNGSAWCQYLTGMNLSAAASATVNDTAPTIDYSMAIVEILAAASAAASPAFSPARMPLGV